jgi:RNA polymerase sigma factor (sigma-70 family)
MPRTKRVLECLAALWRSPLLASGADESPDRVLLTRYLESGDEAAFAALLHRHGPMVLGVCRRLLGHAADAEDAFQATFLLLAQSAGSIRQRDSVGGWLHGTAQRTAAQARLRRARRPPADAGGESAEAPKPEDELLWQELRWALDEELARLPERYRSPMVLCHLEGATQTEAAARLGWSRATLGRRLDRGLALLRARLTGRGLALPAGMLLAGLLHHSARASLPASLLAGSLQAARLLRAGLPPVAVAPPRVAALVRQASPTVGIGKWKVAFFLLLAAGLAGGAGLYAHHAFEAAPPEGRRAAAPPAARPRPAREGDPLPSGVLLRLGENRLWHPAFVIALAYSSDDRTVASLGVDGSVRLWSTVDGRQRGSFKGLAGVHGVPARSVLAFSPDNRLLAASHVDIGLRVFDLTARKEKFRLPASKGQEIRSAAFGPGGKTLVTAGEGGVVLRDGSTGKEVRRFKGHEGTVQAVAFSPDGARLLTGGEATVRLWTVRTGKQVKELLGHRAAVRAVAFSADGKRAASAGADDSVRVWDLASGTQKRRFQPEAWALRFTPDGRALAAGGMHWPWPLHQWDLKTGKDLCKVRTPQPRGAVAFSSSGKALAVAENGHIHLLEIASGKDLCPVAGHRGAVDALAFSPDGRSLATGGVDRRIRLWDTASGKELRVWAGHAGAINALAFSPDGKTLASGALHDKIVSLWDVVTGKERCKLASDANLVVPGLHFSPDGKWLARRNGRNGLTVWEAASGKKRAELVAGRAVRLAAADAFAFAPDGESVTAVSGSDGLLYRWAVRNWKRTARRLPAPLRLEDERGFPADPFLLCSPDGRSLAACNRSGAGTLALSLWDLETLTRLQAFRQPGARPLRGARPPVLHLSYVAFSANGCMLAASGAEEVVVWEVASGHERARLARPGLPAALAFAPDGRRLACGGPDGVVLVHDLDRPGGKGPAPKAKLSPAELDSLWADLRADAGKAFRALGALRAAPASVAPYLARRLKPTPSVPAARLKKLLADLDADDFDARSGASAELEKLGRLAEPALKRLLEGKPSPEARRRAQAILKRVKLSPRSLSRLQLRDLRALEVLEGLARPEARKALEALARGAAGDLLTEQARAALRRQGRRGVPRP